MVTKQSPAPTRLTENVKEDIKGIWLWSQNFFKSVVIEQRLAARVDKVASVAPLTQEISASPTKEEVQALQDKINELITAAK